jgi:glycosyltransferase involved in cell wall biosynthesis
MQALAAELRLQRVEFPGPLYGEDKLRAYRRASVFVLPTYSENFGMSVAKRWRRAPRRSSREARLGRDWWRMTLDGG